MSTAPVDTTTPSQAARDESYIREAARSFLLDVENQAPEFASDVDLGPIVKSLVSMVLRHERARCVAVLRALAKEHALNAEMSAAVIRGAAKALSISELMENGNRHREMAFKAEAFVEAVAVIDPTAAGGSE
jgi:hypothetical protein